MNLQNMAPNAKRSLLVTTIFGALAAGIYLCGVEPTEVGLTKKRTELGELESKHDIMMKNLSGADKVKSRLADLEARKQVYTEAMIVPLLESNAMRAKSILDPIAQGAGLYDTEYEELARRALPVLPKRKVPVQLHARQPIKLSCKGSYQGAVSFLRQVERQFPLVITEAFSVNVSADNASQRIDIVFEWPAKGAVTTKPKK